MQGLPKKCAVLPKRKSWLLALLCSSLCGASLQRKRVQSSLRLCCRGSDTKVVRQGHGWAERDMSKHQSRGPPCSPRKAHSCQHQDPFDRFLTSLVQVDTFVPTCCPTENLNLGYDASAIAAGTSTQMAMGGRHLSVVPLTASNALSRQDQTPTWSKMLMIPMIMEYSENTLEFFAILIVHDNSLCIGQNWEFQLIQVTVHTE